MKVRIGADQAYPVYYIDNGSKLYAEVDVPQETVELWEWVTKEYDAVQMEMGKLSVRVQAK